MTDGSVNTIRDWNTRLRLKLVGLYAIPYRVLADLIEAVRTDTILLDDYKDIFETARGHGLTIAELLNRCHGGAPPCGETTNAESPTAVAEPYIPRPQITPTNLFESDGCTSSEEASVTERVVTTVMDQLRKYGVFRNITRPLDPVTPRRKHEDEFTVIAADITDAKQPRDYTVGDTRDASQLTRKDRSGLETSSTDIRTGIRIDNPIVEPHFSATGNYGLPEPVATYTPPPHLNPMTRVFYRTSTVSANDTVHYGILTNDNAHYRPIVAGSYATRPIRTIFDKITQEARDIWNDTVKLVQKCIKEYGSHRKNNVADLLVDLSDHRRPRTIGSYSDKNKDLELVVIKGSNNFYLAQLALSRHGIHLVLSDREFRTTWLDDPRTPELKRIDAGHWKWIARTSKDACRTAQFQ